MIAVLGFIVLHLALIAVGMVTLRAVGMLELAGRRLAVVSAAVGPAFVVGVAMVMPWLVVALLLGIPLTFSSALLAVLVIAIVVLLAGRRLGGASDLIAADRTGGPGVRGVVVGWTRSVPGRLGLLAAAFVGWGMIALARAPTQGDDARIWSLKALTLTYYGHLQPEIFRNSIQAGGHPIYPLLQPVFEAVLSRAVGHAALGFFHAELWLLLVAAAWTAAFLIWRRPAGSPRPWTNSIWLSAVALLVVIPAVVGNVILGDADVTGSVFLALGVLCVGLWIETDRLGYIALAAVMLSAAASTKDEDTLAAIIVVAVTLGAAIYSLRARPGLRAVRGHLLPVAMTGVYFAGLVLPWRLWLHAHHLNDPAGFAVAPPIPRALNPAYVLHRHAELNLTATAMISQVMQEWNWLLALFLVACGVCIVTGRARRAALFYLTTFIAIVLALLWLYTTTPLRLAFLLPSSMNRTISVFMAITPIAIAHLWSTFESDSPVVDGAPASDQHRETLTA